MPRREPTGKAGELIANAQEAAQRIRTLERADASLLATVVAAVLEETARNRFPAAAILAGLTAEYVEARVVVAALAADARVHVRRRALRCLGRGTPPVFAAEILRAGLADADAIVRTKAASAIGFLGLAEVVRTGAEAEPLSLPTDVSSNEAPESG